MTETAGQALMLSGAVMVIRRQPDGPPTIERSVEMSYHDRATGALLSPPHCDRETISTPTRAELERMFLERADDADYMTLSVTALWFADLLAAWWHSYQGQEQTWPGGKCPFCGLSGDVGYLDWHGDGCLYGFVGRWVKED